MAMGSNARKMAFGGVLSAASLVFMAAASILPSGRIASVAAASVVLMPLLFVSIKYYMLAYAAVSLLSAFLFPMKLPFLMFFMFFGHWPATRKLFSCFAPTPKILLKLLCFLCLLGLFAMIYMQLFVLPEAIVRWIWLAVPLVSVAFIIYDLALELLSPKIWRIYKKFEK